MHLLPSPSVKGSRLANLYSVSPAQTPVKVQKSGPGARAGRVPLRWSRRCVPVAAPPAGRCGAVVHGESVRRPAWVNCVRAGVIDCVSETGVLCVSVCVCSGLSESKRS
ncbi:uncharacterized protein [Zea mays]|uniref:Uncharacterized protein n=1 Tax=Zea mays TaxID=4577 RepID=A0A804MS11_MAIZE|nr:uncharacterized protein LOC103647761 [Zea mays]|eukprot:XP_008670496.1 uncharacterized protein LOC103647761 [Zea mays]